ncbi:MAG TPA: PAS domain S-box protein [Anaerolineales bacterium]|nr:PAS domain S-box protein [Anaerolineales bacterium]
MKTAPNPRAAKKPPKSKTAAKVRRAASKPASSNGKHPPAPYEHAPIAIVESSLEGKHISVNEEFCRILGYEKEELLGRGLKDFTFEDDYQIELNLHEQLVAGKIPFYQFEKRYVRQDGGVTWVELTRSVICDAHENPLYTMGVILDISDRKHSERVLRESAERLRLATETARMFTWEWDFQTQIYTVADNFGQVLGFSAGLLPKNGIETVQRLISTEDLQAVSKAAAKCIASHTDLRALECRVINPENGETVWLEINAKIVYNAEGHAERMFGVAQNVNENKKAQEEIAIISRMPEENPNPVMRLTRSGEVLYANRPSQDLLEAWKQQINQTVPDELQKRVSEVFASGRKGEIEIEQNGKTFSCTLAPVREAGYVNLYGTEITERKRIERDLAESARQQEALYQLADQLHRTNSLEGVFNAALDAIFSALQCDRASILLYDNVDVMRFVAWRRLSDDYRKATDGHSPWTPDVNDPEPICMNDIAVADLSDALRAVIKAEGIGSLAFIPLVSNARLIGKFMTYFDAPHVFSEEEVELSLTIAHQLAFGIERIRAEEELRKSEARFRSYFELGLIGMAITSPSQGILEVNDEICKILGYERSEILTKTWAEMTHPDDLQADGTQFDRVLAGEIDAYSLDKRWIRKDGKIIDSTVSVRAVRRSDSSVDYFVALLQDITERKQAENRLTLLTEISEIIRKFEDPNELLFSVSKAVGEHLQARRCLFNEIDVENDRETVHRDYCRGVESVAGTHKVSDYSSITTAEMIAGKTVVNTDSRTDPRTAQDYERVYVLNGERAYVAVPLMRENRWVASLWVSDDMPREWSREEVSLLETVAERTWTAIEKLRINAALRASEALYRTIARSIPSGGVYVVDRDFRYLVADGVVTESFGLSRERLEGHTASEIFSGESRQRLEEHLRRAFSGETTSSENRRNGRVYWSQYAPLVGSIGQAIVVTLDITERKQVEESLRQSEERFARFMQHLPGLAWIKDVQGHYVYANAAAEKAFSTSREKLYDKTDEEVFPPEVATQFKKNDEQALMDPTGVQVVETLKQGDGVLHYSLVNKFPIPGPDGSTALIGGTAFDITERLQAEEALRESQERYRSLFDLVPIAVYTCDANGLIREYNHRAAELWGREPAKNDPNEKYCGSFKLYYPDGRWMPHENCPMARILNGEILKPDELEILIERQDGLRRNVIEHPLPLKNEHGEIVEAINCLYDITERKQAEDALHQLNLQLESRVQKRTATIQAMNQSLREEIAERKKAEEALRTSEATARLLLNTAPDGVVIADETGVIVHANAQIASLFGYEPDEILGKQVDILIPERFQALHIQHRRTYGEQSVKRVMGPGMDLFGRRKNSDEFPVDVMLTPISNIPGWDVMVTIRDDTERKKMESALRRSHQRLQILSQRLVEVQEEERRALARELHDRVGQTLAALNINLIIINSQLSEDLLQRMGSRMKDSMQLTTEAIALIRNVMTDLRPAVLDDYGLEAALQAYIDVFKNRYGLDVLFEHSDQSIPRLGSSIEMTFLRIAQEALMNIVRHAQASQINLSLRQEEDAVSLIVQDNGMGIVSWQEANRPGSHGLTIMRERAEAFGGNLKVKSVPGQGTKVQVSIPIREHNEVREQKPL